MDKKDVIEYIQNNPSEMYEIFNTFGCYINFKNRDDLIQHYNWLKEALNRYNDVISSTTDEEKKRYTEGYYKLLDRIEEFEKRYHIYEPEFDERSEKMWLPEHMSDKAKSIFEFRKGMYNTQRIYVDKMLTDIISEDMGAIWSEKGGQDGMYDAFPFSFTVRSFVDENSYDDNYLKGHIISKTEYVRHYALDSCGGIAIVEEIYYLKNETTGNEYAPTGRYRILTLGEDDAYHFLNGAAIYEDYYGNCEEFINLLKMCFEEFEKNRGIK